MKSDRELLELAAKASGIVGTWSRGHQTYGDQWIEGLDCGGRFLWNPLVSDGDTLRLAVELKMKITIGNAIVMVEAIGIPDVGVQFTDNPAAATRRAVVRAAAAIGEQMP